jgi:hypothetical protein
VCISSSIIGVTGEHSSKRYVIDSRKISGLRIHVERVIRQMHEFSLVCSLVCINNHKLKHVDVIVLPRHIGNV